MQTILSIPEPKNGISSYRVSQIGLLGLKNTEYLGHVELYVWLEEKYGKYASVRVVCEQTGKVTELTDNGCEWVVVLAVRVSQGLCKG
jgi:hypothetical protein